LHQKLNYKEEQINELTETVVQLTAKLQEETQKNEKQHSTFNQFKESSDCKKLLAIGLSLVKILAKPTDLAELNVVTENINENESSRVRSSKKLEQ
jgi:TolA-binding protein